MADAYFVFFNQSFAGSAVDYLPDFVKSFFTINMYTWLGLQKVDRDIKYVKIWIAHKMRSVFSSNNQILGG